MFGDRVSFFFICSILPQTELYARYIVAVCAIVAVCSYLWGLDGVKCDDATASKEPEAEAMQGGEETAAQPHTWLTGGDLRNWAAVHYPPVALTPRHMWHFSPHEPVPNRIKNVIDKLTEASGLHPDAGVRVLRMHIHSVSAPVTAHGLVFRIELKGNQITVHALSSKPTQPKAPRSSYPLNEGYFAAKRAFN